MLDFPIYLDHNATTPCDPRVLEAMLPYFTQNFGNPSSRYHTRGWEAEEAVKEARIQVAKLIGAHPNEIYFTSGATESINLALKGIFELENEKKNQIISTRAEHKAVLDTLDYLKSRGGVITYIPVGETGQIQVEDIQNSLSPQTLLVSIMMANNETGVVENIGRIKKSIQSLPIPIFTDGTQAVGKIPIKMDDLEIDFMAFTSHKIYGPKGIGALYIRKNSPFSFIAAQIHGGGQERGIRSGTLNVPGIVGFGKACEVCDQEMKTESIRISRLRDRLESGILELEGAEVNGNRKMRIPNTTNISFRNRDIEKWIMKINKYLALSTGSACNTANLEPSHVLLAMGLNKTLALNSLRFGLGRFTTEEEIDFALEILRKHI